MFLCIKLKIARSTVPKEWGPPPAGLEDVDLFQNVGVAPRRVIVSIVQEFRDKYNLPDVSVSLAVTCKNKVNIPPPPTQTLRIATSHERKRLCERAGTTRFIAESPTNVGLFYGSVAFKVLQAAISVALAGGDARRWLSDSTVDSPASVLRPRMSALSAAAGGNVNHQVWFGPRTVTINLTFITMEDAEDAMELASQIIGRACEDHGRAWFEDLENVRLLVERWHDTILEHEIGERGISVTGGKKFLEQNSESWCAGGECSQGEYDHSQNPTATPTDHGNDITHRSQVISATSFARLVQLNHTLMSSSFWGNQCTSHAAQASFYKLVSQALDPESKVAGMTKRKGGVNSLTAEDLDRLKKTLFPVTTFSEVKLREAFEVVYGSMPKDQQVQQISSTLPNISAEALSVVPFPSRSTPLFLELNACIRSCNPSPDLQLQVHSDGSTAGHSLDTCRSAPHSLQRMKTSYVPLS